MDGLFGWKNFNDRLALILVLLVLGVMILSSRLGISETVEGALIAAFTLIVQYYFRRAPEDGGEK